MAPDEGSGVGFGVEVGVGVIDRVGVGKDIVDPSIG